MRSGWLLRDGDVVCALHMTDSAGERWRGLRGVPTPQGGLHMAGTRLMHTVGADAPVDVAFLNADLVVLHVTRLAPWRLSPPRKGARSVLQAEAGMWERWSVQVGDQFEIREVQ